MPGFLIDGHIYYMEVFETLSRRVKPYCGHVHKNHSATLYKYNNTAAYNHIPNMYITSTSQQLLQYKYRQKTSK